MNFLARSLASRNPSATSMISQISSKSGTTIAQGLERSSCSCQGCSPCSYPPTAPEVCPKFPVQPAVSCCSSPCWGLLPQTGALVQPQVEFHQGQGSHSISVPSLPLPHRLFVLLSNGFLVEGGNPLEHPLPLLSSPAHPAWPPLGSDRTVLCCQRLPHQGHQCHKHPGLRSHRGSGT